MSTKTKTVRAKAVKRKRNYLVIELSPTKKRMLKTRAALKKLTLTDLVRNMVDKELQR